MGASFQSFQRTPLGVYVQSPLGVRNGGTTLVFVGDINYVDTDDNVNNVGFYNIKTDLLEKFGLNEGFSGGSFFTVQKILQYKSSLYVCGGFLTSETGGRTFRKIARYDNEDGIWKKLAAVDATVNSTLTDMCLFDGKLIVCGNSSVMNGVTETNAIAAWDGTEWSSVGGDGTNRVLGTLVHRCLAYDGLLYATGNFLTSPAEAFGQRRIKKWDGVSWESLVFDTNDPFTNRPNALEVFRGTLVMGGSGYIYSWDGTAYTALATTFAIGNRIDGSTVYKGDLIVCGNFNGIEGVAARGVARWDGENWFAMGPGVVVATDVHVDTGVLYVTGTFNATGDGDPIAAVAEWNPVDEVWEDTGNRDDFSSNSKNISLASFTGKLDFDPDA